MFTGLDKTLLLHYPRLWQSRILYVVPAWICISVLAVLFGLSSDQYQTNAYSSPGLTYLFFFFISVLSLVIYLFFFTRYNYFKWYGKSHHTDGVVSFLLIFTCVFLLSSGCWIYDSMARLAGDQKSTVWSTETFRITFYISLIFSTLVFIYRHIPSRQFIVGGILLGIGLMIFALFIGFSGTHDKNFLFAFEVLALVALFTSCLLVNTRPTAVHSALYIMYHGFLPFMVLAITQMTKTGRTPETRWITEYGPVFSLMIILSLVYFASYPIMKRQWGRLE